MKRTFLAINAFICVVSISLLFTACHKESLQPATSDADCAVRAVPWGNHLVLETFTDGDRQHRFVYSPNGKLDSIVVTGGSPYFYQVFYKGNHLDSAHLVDRGRLVSTVANFKYAGDLITKYDYFDRYFDEAHSYFYSYSITYDKQKRIRVIEKSTPNTVYSRQEFNYDANDNVVTWHGGFTPNSATYTYDRGLNPLHFVPDLFAIMLEETWIWQYTFSLHNSTSKTYPGGMVTYQNQYNNLGQLATKSFYESGNNLFSFTYKKKTQDYAHF